MNYTIFILWIIFGLSIPANHNVEIAVFHISESKNGIEIDISFDLEDISTALELTPNAINVEKIQEYLEVHFSIELNNDKFKPIVLQTQIIKDHLIIKGLCKNKKVNISTLKINNTCLIEFEKHSNIIQIDLNNTTRDFRMHKGRTSIDIQY